MKNKKTIEYANELLEKDYTDEEIKNFLSQKCQKEEIEEIINIIKLKKELPPPIGSEKIYWKKKETDTKILKEATELYIGVNHALYNIKKIAIIIFSLLVVFELFSYIFYSVLIKDHFNYFYSLFSYTIRPLILIFIFVIAIRSMKKNIFLSIEKLSKEYITNSSKKVVLSSVFSFSLFSLILFGIIGIYGILGLMYNYGIDFSSPEKVPLSTFFYFNFYQFSVLSVVTFIISVFLFSYKTILMKRYFNNNKSIKPKITLCYSIKNSKALQLIFGVFCGLLFIPLIFYLSSFLPTINAIISILIVLFQIIFPIIVYFLYKKHIPIFVKFFLIINIINLIFWFLILVPWLSV